MKTALPAVARSRVTRAALLLPLVLSTCLFAVTPAIADTDTNRIQAILDFVEQTRYEREQTSQTLTLGGRTFPWSTLDPTRVERPGTRAEGAARGMVTDWTPYAGPFDLPEAAHLLHRTIIGPRFEEMDAAVAQGLTPTLQGVLAVNALPFPPAAWATEPFPDISNWDQTMIDSLVYEYGLRVERLRHWWGDRMLEVASSPSIRETMVLFWHDHFATAAEEVILPQSMYMQNALLRQHALGNFKDLVHGIYKDPAMLLWLDNQQNRAGQINENFSRELLELFTMGVDEYTQEDITEAARAFTGWATADGVVGAFFPQYHDYGEKTFLGQVGNWFGADIVEIIFQQDVTARFLCDKLYRWFVDEYPDPVLVEQLATTLRTSNYEILPVLEQLLASEHFFDVNFRGSIITDGIDKTQGLLRTFHLEDVGLYDGFGQQQNYGDAAGPTLWAMYSMINYSHVLLDPPNVAGWPGYRTWINATTLPNRKLINVAVVDGIIYNYDLQMQIDPMETILSLSDPNDAIQIVDDLALLLFGMPPTELVHQRCLDELLQGAEPYDWNINDPEAPSRIQGLMRLMMRLPDYQLK